MIEKAFAKAQVARLSQLDGFPREAPAVGELVLALMVCKTDSTAMQVVTEIIDNAQGGSRCPYPADIRRMVYDRQAEGEKRKCEACGGSGWLTVYRLVTYKGKSLVIEHSEALDLDFEERLKFQKRLPENQAILSGAVACACLPATHHARTGQHA